jgi:hypothetical protein
MKPPKSVSGHLAGGRNRQKKPKPLTSGCAAVKKPWMPEYRPKMRLFQLLASAATSRPLRLTKEKRLVYSLKTADGFFLPN